MSRRAGRPEGRAGLLCLVAGPVGGGGAERRPLGPAGCTMSPGSGVKSEYMKRYREPRWDEYAPCYRELLHYRLGRRLLEQAHAPWLWDDWGPGSGSDDSASSASSGAGSPAPQCAPDSPPPPPPAEPGAREGPERQERGPSEEPAGDAEAGDAEAGDAEAGDAEATSLPGTESRRGLRGALDLLLVLTCRAVLFLLALF